MSFKYTLDIVERSENSVHFSIKNGAGYLTFEEVFNLWETSDEFILFYREKLLGMNFPAFYWEHPAVNEELLGKKYECIVQRSKPLETLPINENAFRSFIHNDQGVADFMNLGKDARLVIPTKKTDKEIYNHMSKFLEFGDNEQIIAVFRRIGSVVLEEIQKQKLIWLNTAGLGIIWLHVRMDTRPKYYKTSRYRNPDFLNTPDNLQ